ncbi:MAG: aminotransferase class V-fold PLP-dependent enzyme [Bacteroidota bacterium]|nr:aminotransferase class V-fold PLP-dependent enzyme [Bacteroidota bacterium]
MKPYFLEKFGNPSSIHRFGQEAKAAIEESRATIAQYIGGQPGEVFFVSSGTESDNFAIKGAALKMQETGKTHIITTKIEHHAVLETCEYLSEHGVTITFLNVDLVRSQKKTKYYFTQMPFKHSVKLKLM